MPLNKVVLPQDVIAGKRVMLVSYAMHMSHMKHVSSNMPQSRHGHGLLS